MTWFFLALNYLELGDEENATMCLLEGDKRNPHLLDKLLKK